MKIALFLLPQYAFKVVLCKKGVSTSIHIEIKFVQFCSSLSDFKTIFHI